MRILGIDPGTHRLGYGLVVSERGATRADTYGCIEPAGSSLSAADRLLALHEELKSVLAACRPDEVAVEELYFARNVTTALRVAEARGVVLLTVRQAGLPVFEYKPNLIKSTVAGYGLAPKDQMGRMVKLLLKLSTIPKPDDAVDGLAVAICHAAHARLATVELTQ